jgi:beta-galactosidase GanA
VLTLPRLPVASLWLDVFQKIKALGYNAVSFYVDWALVEGKQGDFTAEGVFAWEPFFEAAQEAGIYLIAVSLPHHHPLYFTDHNTATWTLHQCRSIWRRLPRLASAEPWYTSHKRSTFPQCNRQLFPPHWRDHCKGPDYRGGTGYSLPARE